MVIFTKLINEDPSKKMEKQYPARLHVLIARHSEKAIVIRRGPSKHTCVLGWDRKKNTFEVSQWFKGRIYERRSDIAPSGKYWIYFAMNGHWKSEAKGSWTAIARTPWLKAISLFSKGDCWNGGGMFLSDHSYWLNDGYGHESMLDRAEVKRDKNYPPSNQYGGECLNVYYNRLQRDEWVMKSVEKSEAIFEKNLPQNWVLRKICHAQIGSPIGKGCYWDEHEVLNHSGKQFIFPEWEWADWADDSIYFAKQGCLYKLNISKDIGKPELLHNFNEYKFKHKQAPY